MLSNIERRVINSRGFDNAIDILHGEYITDNDKFLISPNPEDTYLKMILLNNMSNDAKIIVNLMLNASDATLRHVTKLGYHKTKKKKISITKIKWKRFFRERGWFSSKEINKLFNEIWEVLEDF